MATVVTVHGTFAHVENDPAQMEGLPALQWWQPGSDFEHDIKKLVNAEGGSLDVMPFQWSGANSELERRNAGRDLLNWLKALEARNEPYVVIGHSHGGSVLSAALIEAAGRKLQLPHMRRWITVGTPFVEMRKEQFLVTRLSLAGKVALVGSAMLLIMFLVYLGAEMMSGTGESRRLFGGTFPGVLAVMGLMMSLPIIFFYGVLRYLDIVNLRHHSRKARARAQEYFGDRWLSLTHVDDEAVQGLAFLPGAKLNFFDSAFAVSAITITSILALPLIYAILLASPHSMVWLADLMKTRIYEANSSPAAEQAIIDLRKRLAQQRKVPEGKSFHLVEGTNTEVPNQVRWSLWREYAAHRAELEAVYPDLRAAERSLRFKARFFERNGVPCEAGRLCGQGEDLKVNSGLLLHLVTDEVAWALGAVPMVGGAGSWGGSRFRWLTPIVIPALFVPVVFGAVALVLMVVIKGLAHLISSGLARVLNALTNAEVKRAAFGNDTEGEIALGAVDRPIWLNRTPPRLPESLGELVTTYSNGIATRSITKFRHAIGRLASADPRHTADTAITTYFTWKELVHSAYFDVPEFRMTVAQATARCAGFGPSPAFMAEPGFALTAQWLAEIEGTPGTSAKPAEAAPTDQDAGAVAAAVASTVKAKP